MLMSLSPKWREREIENIEAINNTVNLLFQLPDKISMRTKAIVSTYLYIVLPIEMWN